MEGEVKSAVVVAAWRGEARQRTNVLVPPGKEDYAMWGLGVS
jgi:hypothetical protein